MTLATHAITGAAIASLIPAHPIAGFFAGFASHFVIDAIPHYDYPIYSDSIHPRKGEQRMVFDRAFARDALDFSADALVGIAVSLVAFATPLSLAAVCAGAIGGILPDPLQFLSKKIPYEPLASIQRFHKWIHAKWRLRETGHLTLGVISQLAFVTVVIGIAKLI